MSEMKRGIALALAVVLIEFGCAQAPEPPTGPPVDYDRQIRPLLERYCQSCHGGELRAPSGRLRLHSRERALQGGRSGEPAIVPGDSGSSPLVLGITGRDPDRWRKMPPAGYPGPTTEEVRLIERWIDEGAPWPEAE